MTNPYLPQEILDYIADFLHDELETLKQCCLVSKSWVARTRKYLFTDIKFRSASDLESWKRTFPDVANSPAYHACALFVGCPRVVTASDGKEGGWVRAFTGVKRLDVDGGDRFLRVSEISLAPFREFSPLKSLHIGSILIPYPGLFDFILFFPLLEDLNLTGSGDPQLNDDGPHKTQTTIPSTSPPLTGFLNFHLLGGAGGVARQLLGLPNGLHFRKLALSRDHKMDLWWITELVTKCSHTLESLEVFHTFRLGSEPGSFDLSKATRLRDLVFRPESQSVEWITMALQTITPEHQDLQRVSIHIPYHLTFFGLSVGRILGGGGL